MKIMLVKPYNLSDHIQPSLGLGYLATACRKKHEVAMIDCLKDKVKINKLLSSIRRHKPDIVGFQCYTFDLRFIREALIKTKRLDKRIKTIIGGPHPSAVPRETFSYFKRNLDYIFVGESEKGLPMLLDELDNGSASGFDEIPGLAWKKDGDIKINPQLFVEDLDSLGMPAWDLIKPEEYPESQHGAFFKKFPIAPIMVTRGCPFSCTFCAGNVVAGRKIRTHSVDFILRQITLLHDKHGVREFHIVDDNFTFNKDFAKSLLRRLIDLNLDISWATPNGVRVDTLDDELLSLMKKSGLYLVSLGIESGSDRVLGLMKKHVTTEKVRRGIEMISKHGIEVAGFFIVGFPGEKKTEIRDTIRFSLNLDLVRANYFTYLPFPGTSSYKELTMNGELGAVRWDKFYFMSAPYVPAGVTRRQLKYFQRAAFLRFYLRPRLIIKNVMDIQSFRHFKFLLKRFFSWIIKG